MAHKGKPHYDAVVESFLAENRAVFFSRQISKRSYGL
jgi:hypothetical protein